MKKVEMKMAAMTFEEGCKLYLQDCKQRNLREATINHYRQSYDQFYRYFDPDMPLEQFDAAIYNDYVVYLRESIDNDVSINSYLRDLITTMHFLMREGYVQSFRMRSIKVDTHSVETYSEDELQKLLCRPNIRKCSYVEYQCWQNDNLKIKVDGKFSDQMNFSGTIQPSGAKFNGKMHEEERLDASYMKLKGQKLWETSDHMYYVEDNGKFSLNYQTVVKCVTNWYIVGVSNTSFAIGEGKLTMGKQWLSSSHATVQNR